MPETSSLPDARFEACLAQVLALEGGYSDNPRDPGGATNFGVTRKTLASWRQISPWAALPKSAVKALKHPEAAAIYKALYWDRCAAGSLPAGLDLALFDFAVNSGPPRAIKTLQAGIDAPRDGIIGPQTRAAIAARAKVSGVGGLIVNLCDRRLNFLHRLLAFPDFGVGWSRRVAVIRAASLTMAGVSPASPIPPTGPLFPSINIGVIMSLLSGYKTYIVGAAMLIAALAQLLGVALPALDGQSAGDLLMQGLAIIFLRHGVTNAANKS